MDASEVKAIVELVIEDLRDALTIPHWRISVDYGPCEDANHGAECSRQPDYYQANITIDPQRMNSTKHVIETLRHELLHVVLADFDLMFDVSDMSNDATYRLWTHAVERTVATMEKLFHDLTERQLHLLQKLEYPKEQTDGKK